MRNVQDCQSIPSTGRGKSIVAINFFLLLGTALLVGCGSGKTAVEGYDQGVLNGKRIFLLLPAEGGIVLTNPAAFAQSRGIGEGGASGRISTEFRTDLAPALNTRLDSNTILEYSQQTVGAVVPLNPSSDMPRATAGSDSWDWDKLRDAARQGNIDYLIVFHSIRVENEMPKEGAARGKETVTANFSLLDPEKKKLMSESEVRVEIKDPRKPADTFTRLSEAMAKKMPFHVAD